MSDDSELISRLRDRMGTGESMPISRPELSHLLLRAEIGTGKIMRSLCPTIPAGVLKVTGIPYKPGSIVAVAQKACGCVKKARMPDLLETITEQTKQPLPPAPGTSQPSA